MLVKPKWAKEMYVKGKENQMCVRHHTNNKNIKGHVNMQAMQLPLPYLLPVVKAWTKRETSKTPISTRRPTVQGEPIAYWAKSTTVIVWH